MGALRIAPAIRTHLLPISIVAFAVFLGLGYPWLKTQRENLPFNFKYFAGYLACVAAEIAGSLFKAHRAPGDFSFHAASFLMNAAIVLKIPLLALACIPLPVWVRMVRATGLLWLYAYLAGAVAWLLVGPSQSLWTAADGTPGKMLQVGTFDTVRWILRGFLPKIADDPASYTIWTPHYGIILGYGCAGIEGLGLIFAFTSIWLWYCRKECRFPQALLLVPCALVCIWALDVVRLCAFVFIGNAGYPDVANIGFHSRAGWISFTAVALAFSLLTQNLSWVRKAPAAAGHVTNDGTQETASAAEHAVEERGESPAIRAYLVPFLAILAASFISKAASGYFEWLYPLRFVAALVALYCFRSELKKLDWHFGWQGPAAGAAVFVLWVAPAWAAHFLGGHPFVASHLGPALAALSPGARWSWIVARVAAAVITVPIAEELAFRGYLARRVMNREFDRVAFSSLTALSIGLSSLAFGLMHGEHWFVGILAGLAYAGVLRWRGRMGEAVAAHAVSNLLLAAWVLGLGDWSQW